MDKGSEGAMEEELSQGLQYAYQLRDMMLRDDTSSSASCLVENILHSFNHSISILLNNQAVPLKSETPTHKHRRGCYKRRKTSEILIKETASLVEDGHAWRKYGQKAILNAKNPRNYYRCTHKFDQGCQATKQVQKIQDDPFPLFKTTYLGHHTCSSNSPAHQIIMDHHDSNNSIIWCFDSMIKPENSSYKSEASSSSSAVLDSDHQLRCTDNNLSAISSSASDNYAGDVYSTTHHCTTEMNNLIFDQFLALCEDIN